MAEMEKDHDPRDLLAILVFEQHISTGPIRLHHNLCYRSERLSDNGISIDILPDFSLRHGNARHRAHVPQIWP